MPVHQLIDPFFFENRCEHIFDRIGCVYNSPANYAQINGTFQSCQGDDQLFPGVYEEGGRRMTYTQPPESLGVISTIPYTPFTPSSSSCSTYQSSELYTAAAALVSGDKVLIDRNFQSLHFVFVVLDRPPPRARLHLRLRLPLELLLLPRLARLRPELPTAPLPEFLEPPHLNLPLLLVELGNSPLEVPSLLVSSLSSLSKRTLFA